VVCFGKIDGDSYSRDGRFYIAIDEFVISAQSLLRAFEVLFKSHYVFNLEFEASLKYVFNFFDVFIFKGNNAVPTGITTSFFNKVKN
jgi:hypothetical protein